MLLWREEMKVEGETHGDIQIIIRGDAQESSRKEFLKRECVERKCGKRMVTVDGFRGGRRRGSRKNRKRDGRGGLLISPSV